MNSHFLIGRLLIKKAGFHKHRHAWALRENGGVKATHKSERESLMGHVSEYNGVCETVWLSLCVSPRVHVRLIGVT